MNCTASGSEPCGEPVSQDDVRARPCFSWQESGGGSVLSAATQESCLLPRAEGGRCELLWEGGDTSCSYGSAGTWLHAVPGTVAASPLKCHVFHKTSAACSVHHRGISSLQLRGGHLHPLTFLLFFSAPCAVAFVSVVVACPAVASLGSTPL